MKRRANEEIWIDIKDYEGHYQVSNMGRVKSLKSNIILSTTQSNGYYRVNLSKNSIVSNKNIHRLVMENFCPIDNMDEMTVYHIYGDRGDNRLKNLRWAKKKKDKYQITQAEQIRGEDNGRAVLTWDDVKYIRSNYKRGDSKFSRSCMAKKFGVSERQISKIINNQQWIEER